MFEKVDYQDLDHLVI